VQLGAFSSSYHFVLGRRDNHPPCYSLLSGSCRSRLGSAACRHHQLHFTCDKAVMKFASFYKTSLSPSIYVVQPCPSHCFQPPRCQTTKGELNPSSSEDVIPRGDGRIPCQVWFLSFFFCCANSTCKMQKILWVEGCFLLKMGTIFNCAASEKTGDFA